MDATSLPPGASSASSASTTKRPGGGGEEEEEEEGRRSSSPSRPGLTSGTARFCFLLAVALLLCYGVTNDDCDSVLLWTTSAARPWSAANGGGTGPGSGSWGNGKPPGVRGGIEAGTLNATDPETTEVVWLMSFPNSGTSYTIRNTERLSQRNTATNYAEDFAVLAPVRPDLADDGPFLHDPGLPPAHKVLTKTHCGAYCVMCEPRGYVQTVETFERECRSGRARDRGGEAGARRTTYPPIVPSAAVHLVRNPFDNLVARMHLAAKRAARSGASGGDPGSVAVPPPGAMVAWCRVIDALHPELERSSDLITSDIQLAWQGLPCRAEWFRYVQWHNRALEVTARFQAARPDGFPVHLLYYEDYSTDYNATVDALFSFLDLEFRGSPVPFIPGKSYHNYFSVHDRKRAAQFVKAMATPDCWATVKHYFDGMIG